jgi:hypothetical protein
MTDATGRAMTCACSCCEEAANRRAHGRGTALVCSCDTATPDERCECLFCADSMLDHGIRPRVPTPPMDLASRVALRRPLRWLPAFLRVWLYRRMLGYGVSR